MPFRAFNIDGGRQVLDGTGYCHDRAAGFQTNEIAYFELFHASIVTRHSARVGCPIRAFGTILAMTGATLFQKVNSMATVSLNHVKQEFAESLGYIRQDLRWLIEHDSGLNYTIALLLGCGCEMLAALDHRNRQGERVFADLLPSGEWQILADRLYGALRDGLAHGFDTKHLFVDGTEYQIYLSVRGPQEIKIRMYDRGIGLYIGIRSLAEALCARITDFEALLEQDQDARHRFMEARQRTADLNSQEAGAWRSLVAAAGL